MDVQEGALKSTRVLKFLRGPFYVGWILSPIHCDTELEINQIYLENFISNYY